MCDIGGRGMVGPDDLGRLFPTLIVLLIFIWDVAVLLWKPLNTLSKEVACDYILEVNGESFLQFLTIDQLCCFFCVFIYFLNLSAIPANQTEF